MPLDQQINGVTDMLYINAVSGDDGSANLTVTFALERDPDLAAVEVQNRVSQAQAAAAAGGHRAGRHGAQAVSGHADVLRGALAGRHLRPAVHRQLRLCLHRRPAEARQGRGRCTSVRLRVRHADLAAPRSDGEPQDHRRGRRARDPRAERPGAGRTDRAAAVRARPELPVLAARARAAGRRVGIRRHHRRLASRTDPSFGSATSAASSSARATTTSPASSTDTPRR